MQPQTGLGLNLLLAHDCRQAGRAIIWLDMLAPTKASQLGLCLQTGLQWSAPDWYADRSAAVLVLPSGIW